MKSRLAYLCLDNPALSPVGTLIASLQVMAPRLPTPVLQCPPQQPVLPWTLWPPRTHHDCSVGSLVSDVQDSTAFSWILALRARAWAPNLRARLRQDWSSERESFEGT